MKIETLQKDMIAAMKAGDKERKDVISALVGNIKKAAIDNKMRDSIPEDLVDACILKEKKTIQEQIDTCPAERTELLDKYKHALSIIDSYAPQMMSEEEILAFLRGNCSEEIASGNKGMIMKKVMPALKGKADGQLINKIVASLLG